MTGVEEFRAPRKDLLLRGTGILGLGLGAKLLAGILTGFTPLGEGRGGRVAFASLTVLLIGAGISLASFGSARAFRFGEGGIRVARWLAPGLALPWEEIAGVESTSGIGLFRRGESWVIHLRSGRRVRLNVEGFPEKDRRAIYGRIHARVAAPAGRAA